MDEAAEQPQPEAQPELEADPAAVEDPELDAAIQALTPEEERRDRRIWTGLIIAGVVVVVLFLIGFWPVMRGRLEAAKQLDQAIALVEQAGGTIAGIDNAVTAQLSPDAAPTAPDISAAVLVARRELDQAQALIDDGMPHLTEDEQKRGNLALDVLKARRTMIQTAPTILSASAKAVRAKAIADRGWASTQQASVAETRVVDGWKLQTASAIQTASATIPVIQSELTSARIYYSQATTAFPSAGFERYTAYVDLRRKAITQLGVATKLWLAGSVLQAKAAFALYKVADAKADAAFVKLPYAPGTATGQAFRALAGRAVDEYAKAKQQAADSDKALKTP